VFIVWFGILFYNILQLRMSRDRIINSQLNYRTDIAIYRNLFTLTSASLNIKNLYPTIQDYVLSIFGSQSVSLNFPYSSHIRSW